VKRNLSPFDLATCKITPGTTLIEASAGTGKTYSLAGLVLRLLLEGHASAIGKILVMTFTKAATAELVERIRKSVAEAAAAFAHGGSDDDFLTGLVRQHGAAGARVASAALRDLDDIEVSTIHSFCRRVLERHALEVGVPFELEYVENDRTLLQRAAEDFWRRTVYPAGRVAARVIADEQITPNAFVEQYRRTRRHPRLRIEPAALPLDAAIAGLESAGELGDAEVEAFTHALRMRFIEEVGPLFEREKRIASVAGYDDLRVIPAMRCGGPSRSSSTPCSLTSSRTPTSCSSRSSTSSSRARRCSTWATPSRRSTRFAERTSSPTCARKIAPQTSTR
jgi:exodeoxyribonuclease V beta subunit